MPQLVTTTSDPPPLFNPIKEGIRQHLKDQTLRLLTLLLLKLLDINVLPDPDRRNAQRNKAGTRNDHQALRVRISANNSIALGRAIRKRHLHDEIAENSASLVLGLLGEELVQLLRGDAVPHGAGDGVADGRPEATEKAPECVHGGDLLVGDRRHDSELAAGGEDAGAQANEDLSQGQDTDRGVGLTEWNQKGCSQKSDWNTAHGDPLVVARVADQDTDERAKDRRGKREGVQDVASVFDALSVYNL